MTGEQIMAGTNMLALIGVLVLIAFILTLFYFRTEENRDREARNRTAKRHIR